MGDQDDTSVLCDEEAVETREDIARDAVKPQHKRAEAEDPAEDVRFVAVLGYN